MKRLAKTKIIATLGPASDNSTVLRKMMLAGMDVARLNFSHGNHLQHLNCIKIVRTINKKYRRNVRILQDLEGYRIRIGTIPGNGIDLEKKSTVLLSNKRKVVVNGVIPLDYDGSLDDIKTGNFIYIDDGNITLLVKGRTKNYLKTEVIVSGRVKTNKGVNVPDIKLKFKNITEKDKLDLAFGIKHKVDFIAQSFVRNKQDILNIRKHIDNNINAKLIAKIENRDGIKNIDEILDVADGIMIARGDMGISLPIYQVPVMQKMIIKKCKQRKKFVITATQMLESMTEHLRPTRAEVSDVANAIYDGSNYVMLSGETAAGMYPVETVKMMDQIIKFTETSKGLT
ncbi:MAG: pyruvate kinase [Candidatus Orphnella occulta]|nr:pyruvate kinase [Candidatus Orphnella occulta]MDP8296645.1 pyruvate kinase [Candidatus Orphnella occulta]